MSPELTFLVICMLSGLLMIDKYSFGEFGISQPLVSAPVIGFAAGDFLSGAILGVLLQPVWLLELPIGRKVPLDAQAAGVSGAVAFFVLRGFSDATESAVVLAVIIAAASSIWGGWLDIWERRLNGVLAKRLERVKHRRELFFIHFAALDVAFLRGFFLALLAAGVAVLASPLLRANLVPPIALNKLLAATLSVGLASGLVLFGIKKRLIPVLVGFASWVLVWVLVRF